MRSAGRRHRSRSAQKAGPSGIVNCCCKDLDRCAAGPCAQNQAGFVATMRASQRRRVPLIASCGDRRRQRVCCVVREAAELLRGFCAERSANVFGACAGSASGPARAVAPEMARKRVSACKVTWSLKCKHRVGKQVVKHRFHVKTVGPHRRARPSLAGAHLAARGCMTFQNRDRAPRGTGAMQRQDRRCRRR